ncbi:MAG: SDR family NAD(P)-dependent oxidoreductase, partial [Bacteroidales bacterium]|nr:SDR family NAD(P)-dependent oxidoreductase [Bacteroidales bacterium]
MKKIVVTGGTGYIGSHTTVALMEKGYQVVIADNLYNSDERVLDAIAQITGIRPLFENVDLTDAAACMQLFRRHADLEAVIHFAAYKSVNESVAKPLA